jgi:ribosomal protein L11 methyltransferase
MNWIEARVVFECSVPAVAIDLISNIFYDFGLQGVAIEEPEQPGGCRETYAVVGYIPMDPVAEKRRQIMESRLFRLKQEHGIRYRVFYKQTAQEDWAESWKEFFKPEKISPRMVVKPTWRAYLSQPEEIVLQIDPGMAFGTGTHPTTVLCLRLMETYLRPGNTFLDVGTGSGILMVAAAKLGSRKILGIDVDPTAVEIARENLRINGVSSGMYEVRTGRLISGVDDRFQLVAANILTETILVLLNDLRTVLTEDGTFILSGITKENTRRILRKIDASGFKHLETRIEEEWIAVAGTC